MDQPGMGTAPGGLSVEGMLEQMQSNISAQLGFCAELEAIADTLPDNVDRQACLRIARGICPALRDMHAFEEGLVFPVLKATGEVPGIEQTIERLRFEHWEDESFAAELQETLQELVNGEQLIGFESIGYMLRGFFEGMRRHVAFEREYVVPLLARITT